jgi:hypothetical protein
MNNKLFVSIGIGQSNKLDQARLKAKLHNFGCTLFKIKNGKGSGIEIHRDLC